MEIHYDTFNSPLLGQDLEYKVYGYAGRGVLVFPTQGGRFFDYENFGMIDVLCPWIEQGRLRVICCDSRDNVSWSSLDADSRMRIERHEKWFRHITEEFLPALRLHPDETFITTGCDLGAFHAANAFFRRPDLFDTLIAQSGWYSASFAFGSYHDELTYANSPLAFLPNMQEDHPYLKLYRQHRIIVCVGKGQWESQALEGTRRLDEILCAKCIPAWFDYWGYDVSHDWNWWRRQIGYFMEKVLED